MADEDQAVVLPCHHVDDGTYFDRPRTRSHVACSRIGQTPNPSADRAVSIALFAVTYWFFHRGGDSAGQLYPEEVSAYVLAHLLAAAELQLHADVSKAVISVPAYFSEAQREATITAGRIAGLDTVKLIRCRCLLAATGAQQRSHPDLTSDRISILYRAQCSRLHHHVQLSCFVRGVHDDISEVLGDAQEASSGRGTPSHILRSVVRRREPVAAALAYGLGVADDETVLVLDLGGGTFDVSILEVGGGTIEVLSTGGDPHLGALPHSLAARSSLLPSLKNPTLELAADAGALLWHMLHNRVVRESCNTGGDDWDAAIVTWLIEEHLQPAVRPKSITHPCCWVSHAQCMTTIGVLFTYLCSQLTCCAGSGLRRCANQDAAKVHR